MTVPAGNPAFDPQADTFPVTEPAIAAVSHFPRAVDPFTASPIETSLAVTAPHIPSPSVGGYAEQQTPLGYSTGFGQLPKVQRTPAFEGATIDPVNTSLRANSGGMVGRTDRLNQLSVRLGHTFDADQSTDQQQAVNFDEYFMNR